MENYTMPHDPVVLGFSDYRQQGESLAKELGIKYVEVNTHYFPDGEVSVTLPTELPSHVIICRSLNNPNNKLVELIFTINTARELGAQHITLIAPYLCYMRQDIAFHPGESVSQKIIGELFNNLIDALITVDPHLHRTSSLENIFTERQTLNVSTAPLIGAFIADTHPNAVIVGPDEESNQWVSSAAQHAGCSYAIARKTRHGDRDVVIQLPDFDFSEKDIVLLDDIISSGHTILKAVQALKEAGANKIYAFTTHAIFDDSVLELLRKSDVEEIWSTDSVSHVTNIISLVKPIASACHSIIPKTDAK